jgi:hypothetical protein
VSTATTYQPKWDNRGEERRSVELAEKAHAEYAAQFEKPRTRAVYAIDARFRCSNAYGDELWLVTSRHDTTTRYTVRYNPDADLVASCNCQAGALGRPCCHRGEVRMTVERRKVRCAAQAMPVAEAPALTIVRPAKPLAYGTCEACGRQGVELEPVEVHMVDYTVDVWACAGGCDGDDAA